MGKYIITGGNELKGEVKISPAKNACLPIIASCVMLNGEILLKNAPQIADVEVMAEIIRDLGGEYDFLKEGLYLNTLNLNNFIANREICNKARASFFIAGALISKFKKAVVPLPGGCNIGERPVDIHISALEQLGVMANIENGYVFFNGENVKSGEIILSYPSVGATVNAICATVFLKGESKIINAAKEPEIIDLCNFLIKCGCKIFGAGSSEILIKGVTHNEKVSIEYLPILDRIEAGTFMCMLAVSGGKITFNYDNFEYIRQISNALERCGTTVIKNKNLITVESNGNINPTNVIANVHPAFPTDLQSVICAVLCYAKGCSRIEDRVFKKRFECLKELVKMGASVKFYDGWVEINGKKELYGKQVYATDLRGGAALLVAGLKARGVTEIENSNVIKRGYYILDKKLKELGANIEHKN